MAKTFDLKHELEKTPKTADSPVNKKEPFVDPLDDRVVILTDEAVTKTPGGILLPDRARDKPSMGTVLVIGPGRTLADGTVKPIAVKTGQHVLYTRYAGVEVPGCENTIIVREDDILAVYVERSND